MNPIEYFDRICDAVEKKLDAHRLLGSGAEFRLHGYVRAEPQGGATSSKDWIESEDWDRLKFDTDGRIVNYDSNGVLAVQINGQYCQVNEGQPSEQGIDLRWDVTGSIPIHQVSYETIPSGKRSFLDNAMRWHLGGEETNKNGIIRERSDDVTPLRTFLLDAGITMPLRYVLSGTLQQRGRDKGTWNQRVELTEGRARSDIYELNKRGKTKFPNLRGKDDESIQGAIEAVLAHLKLN